MPHLSSQVFHPLTCRLLPPLIPSSWLFWGRWGWWWWWSRGLNSTLNGVCVFLFVYVCMHICEVEVCEDMNCVCVCVWGVFGRWGMQGCEVGSFSSPDELAGICKRWITRQRESIIQREKKKKKEIGPCACGPRVPFPIQRVIFPKYRGEEKQPWRSEGGMMRSWKKEKERMNETAVYVYPHPALLTFFPPPFSRSPIKSRRQSAVWKCKRLLSGLQSAQMPLMMDECGI